jgi:hypothetical protein
MKTIEDVLRNIKEAYHKKTQEIDRVVLHVEEKLQAYKRASQQDLLNAFLARNGFEVEPKATDEAALALYEAVGELPEFGDGSSTELDEVDEPEAAQAEAVAGSAELQFPLLAAASVDRPVCIFGGYVVEEKLAWIRRQGIAVEWVGNDGGVRKLDACERLMGQIKANKFCGVITLQELMSHRESAGMLSACRASGTPHAFGRKAGRGQLAKIFQEFERVLKEAK